MWASGKRRRQTAGDINPGLHASEVACVHMANEVGQWYVTSAMACTHQSWRVRMAGHHRPWLVRIGQRQLTSTKPCTHQLWRVRIWQTTSAKQHATSAKAYTHQSWRVRIGWATSVMAYAYRSTRGDFGQDLQASTVACAHRLDDISRGLRAFVEQRRPTTGSISQGLHTSDMACVHRCDIA
ncbi:hypothetical protein H5410_014749 [Solanum commersonii]|uniref:Uncharacterized protein n=1 Tax=Solanum commersonii TaxID=4109 RepID=A0A9J5ZRQ9_SOLCO|nr:hypothetical protein H5410_014749 [Solanum commersonii]